MRLLLPMLLGLLSLPRAVSAAELDALTPGTVVRVRERHPESPWVRGNIVRVGDGRLVLRTAATERQFPLGELRALEANIGNRSRAGRGALFGGLAGIIIGAAAGSGQGDDFICCWSSGEKTALAASGGAAIGLVAGALVGANFRAWERVPLDQALGHRGDPSSGRAVLRLAIEW